MITYQPILLASPNIQYSYPKFKLINCIDFIYSKGCKAQLMPKNHKNYLKCCSTKKIYPLLWLIFGDRVFKKYIFDLSRWPRIQKRIEFCLGLHSVQLNLVQASDSFSWWITLLCFWYYLNLCALFFIASLTLYTTTKQYSFYNTV